ncbi:hypothetical protein ACFX1X_042557 [Malus domestica]
MESSVTSFQVGRRGRAEQKAEKSGVFFKMPLHYPTYSKSDYETMPEGKLDRLLSEYGLPVVGSVEKKRKFAMGAILWPRGDLQTLNKEKRKGRKNGGHELIIFWCGCNYCHLLRYRSARGSCDQLGSCTGTGTGTDIGFGINKRWDNNRPRDSIRSNAAGISAHISHPLNCTVR